MKQSVDEGLRRVGRGRVGVVGVGRLDRGDDAAGMVLAQRLKRCGLPVVLAEDVPESYTDAIKSLGCDVILFVDAVDFGGAPGDVALLSADELRDDRHDTHRPSLALVMKYLAHDAKLECLLLGIQPSQVRQGSGLSQEVQNAVEEIGELVCEILRE